MSLLLSLWGSNRIDAGYRLSMFALQQVVHNEDTPHPNVDDFITDFDVSVTA